MAFATEDISIGLRRASFGDEGDRTQAGTEPVKPVFVAEAEELGRIDP